MSETTFRRRRFIEKHSNLSGAKLLEIGPLAFPTYSADEADIKYMDWCSAEELRERFKEDPNVEVKEIVDVDYVIKQKSFSKLIDDKFDLIIGSHTIEHIPDVISWICELQNLLSPNGALFLCVPDRRYTFDVLRPQTTFVDLLRCHRENLEKPS